MRGSASSPPPPRPTIITSALAATQSFGFAALAREVAALPLIDRESADHPAIAAALRDSRLIYMLGGFTHYLGRTLLGSASWRAILAAYADGAVVAGSSAGAMVMCEHYYDPESGRVFASKPSSNTSS